VNLVQTGHPVLHPADPAVIGAAQLFRLAPHLRRGFDRDDLITFSRQPSRIPPGACADVSDQPARAWQERLQPRIYRSRIYCFVALDRVPGVGIVPYHRICCSEVLSVRAHQR
jgi:hypothetical protein